MSDFIFSSDRLGFRPWTMDDVAAMAVVSADPQVMEYFPSTQSREVTEGFVKRMITQYEEHGLCYFPAVLLATGEVIGFIGVCYQDWEADFLPAYDIGWRLRVDTWGRGLATEGARACLDYAFRQKGLEKILSMAVVQNAPSIRVMEKLGMTFVKNFEHPKLVNEPEFKDCVLYMSERKGS